MDTDGSPLHGSSWGWRGSWADAPGWDGVGPLARDDGALGECRGRWSVATVWSGMVRGGSRAATGGEASRPYILGLPTGARRCGTDSSRAVACCAGVKRGRKRIFGGWILISGPRIWVFWELKSVFSRLKRVSMTLGRRGRSLARRGRVGTVSC